MRYKQTPQFFCRCSAIGQLMTPARSKTQTLSETAKSMLITWYKEKLYDRRKEIQSKYLTKGNECEDNSITYINGLYGTEYQKNEQFFKNEYIHGTPDIIEDDLIIDIKNSWDFLTFPLFSKELPSKEYYWQVQGYMWLTGKRNGSVIYTLMDLPPEQIEQEYKRFGNKGAVTPEFAALHTYSNVDDSLRVKRFDFEYDEDAVAQIIDKVEAARNFLKALSY